MDTLAEMLARLRAHPNVTGVIGYGTDHADNGYQTGDVDLFAVFSGWEPPVESLHFDVGTVPVDLNLITLQRLENLPPALTFPQLALRDGRTLLDRTGAVTRALARLQEGFSSLQPEAPPEHAVAFMRHGHRHLLDKLRGRLEDEPLLANVLLGTNVHWLLQSYLRVRGLPFEGERHTLDYLREQDAEILELLEAFYQADALVERLRLTEVLTAHVLGPVDGAWQRGEVLAFDVEGGPKEAESLVSRGFSAYRELFGEDVS